MAEHSLSNCDNGIELPLNEWETQQEEEANQPLNKVEINFNVWELKLFFSPYQATSIILGLNPYQLRNSERHDNFKPIEDVLIQYVREKIFNKSKLVLQKNAELGDIEVIEIHREDLLYFSNYILKIPLTLKPLPSIKDSTFTSNYYDGEIPLNTDKDKLAHFIKLIIQKSEFMKNGKMPTYSELHTMLNHAYTKEKIPSKNTLNKYLNP